MIRTGDNLITFTVTSTMLILVVCRTPATYELSYMTMFFISCRSSVDKAPARCLGGHWFDSYRDSDSFLCVLISALFCFRSQKFQGLLRGALKDKLVADTLVPLSKQLTPVKSLIGLYFLCGTLLSLQDTCSQNFSLFLNWVLNRSHILAEARWAHS